MTSPSLEYLEASLEVFLLLFFLVFYDLLLFIYLAVSDLSCGVQSYLVLALEISCPVTCGISVP